MGIRRVDVPIALFLHHGAQPHASLLMTVGLQAAPVAAGRRRQLLRGCSGRGLVCSKFRRIWWPSGGRWPATGAPHVFHAAGARQEARGAVSAVALTLLSTRERFQSNDRAAWALERRDAVGAPAAKRLRCLAE